jgi:hypothetical protein
MTFYFSNNGAAGGKIENQQSAFLLEVESRKTHYTLKGAIDRVTLQRWSLHEITKHTTLVTVPSDQFFSIYSLGPG